MPTYARLLLLDFSFAFNTISSHKLHFKLDALGLDGLICNWILDFHLDRPQVVKIGLKIYQRVTLNTGGPQSCVLSTMLCIHCSFTIVSHHLIAHWW